MEKSSIVDLVARWLGSGSGAERHPNHHLPPYTVSRPGTVRVKRRFVPLWVEKRWRKRGNSYFGYYRTKYGAYEGRIVYRYAGNFSFYIKNLPDCLWNHSHRECFMHKGGQNYEVHFARKGKTIDDGILAIERILTEAHEIED